MVDVVVEVVPDGRRRRGRSRVAGVGKVVFSDMRVSGGPATNNGTIPPYPLSGGNTTTLSEQEKALAFMFFDIASCVGRLF